MAQNSEGYIGIREAPPVIEADVYEVALVHYEMVDGTYGAQRKCYLEVVDDGFEGVTLTAYVNEKKGDLLYARKSRGYELLTALLGRDLREYVESGLRVQWQNLINKHCRVSVSVGKKENGEGEFNKIESYLPLKKQQQASGSRLGKQAVAAGAKRVEPPSDDEPPFDPDEEPN